MMGARLRGTRSLFTLSIAAALLAASSVHGQVARPRPVPGSIPVPAVPPPDTSTATYRSCPGTPAPTPSPGTPLYDPIHAVADLAPCWLGRCEAEEPAGNPFREQYVAWCRCTVGMLVNFQTRFTEQERDELARAFRRTLAILAERYVLSGELIGMCRT